MLSTYMLTASVLHWFFRPYVAHLELCLPTSGILKDFHPTERDSADSPNNVYSVSLNQRMSRSIVAQLCESGKPIAPGHPDFSERENQRFFDLESWSMPLPNGEITQDPLVAKNGFRLCQYASNNFPLHDARRYDRKKTYSSFICGNATSSKTFMCNIKIFKNKLIAEGLYHTMSNVLQETPNRLKRIIRFVYRTTSGATIHVDTSPIEIITNPAVGLEWTKQPPREVIANNPFDISLSILDRNREVITTGIDSKLLVQVTVAYTLKYFLSETRVENQLFLTKQMMEGGEEGNRVIQSKINYDAIMKVEAVNGRVDFRNIRLLDMTNNLIGHSSLVHLNATLIVPRTHVRQPDEYCDVDPQMLCYQQVNASSADTHWAMEGRKVYTFSSECGTRSMSKAVVFSDAIKVTPQMAMQLRILSSGQLESTTPKIAGASFQVPDLWVEVLDGQDIPQRIHSGPDSELTVTVKTVPSVNCQTDEAMVFTTYRGIGRFRGSVCQLNQTVKFVFKASTRLGAGQPFNVTSSEYHFLEDITLSIYGAFKSSGRGNDPLPNIETFAIFAVEDINAGTYSQLKHLKGRKLIMITHDTMDDIGFTVNKYISARSKEDDNPYGDIRGVIGFGSDQLMEKMVPLINTDVLPVIAYRATSDLLAGSLSYSTLLSVNWNSMSVAINFALMLRARYWNKIVILYCLDNPIPQPIDRKFQIFHVNVERLEISVIPNWETSETGLVNEMKQLKEFGTNIIFHYIPAPYQYYVYRQAIRYGVASMHGYQWITIEEPARQFPWANEHPICQLEPWCNVGMKGMLLIMGTYDLGGLASDAWFRVNNKYFGMDREKYHGVPTARTETNYGPIAVGYDAVLTLAHAFNSLLGQQPPRAIKEWDVINNIARRKEDYVHGLTGNLIFSDDMRRTGFVAEVHSVCPGENVNSLCPAANRASRWSFVPYILEAEIVSKHAEILEGGEQEIFDAITKKNWHHEVPFTIPSILHNHSPADAELMSLQLPNSSNWIVRYYISKRSAVLHQETNLKKIFEAETVLRTEFIVPAFTCRKDGCGGYLLHIWSATQYEHGTCSDTNKCRCKHLREVYPDKLYKNKTEGDMPAYTTANCGKAACSEECTMGKCVHPMQCDCDFGWKNENCSEAICSGGCKNGNCSAPDRCDCNIGYYGQNCSFMLFVAIPVGIALFLALAVGIFFFARWYWKRRYLQKQLSNLDWLVDWKDVNERTPQEEAPAREEESRHTARDSIVIYKKLPSLIQDFTSPQPGRLFAGGDSSSTPVGSEAISLASAREIIAEVVGDPTGLKASSREPSRVDEPSYTGMISCHGQMRNLAEWKAQICYVQKFNRSSLDVNLVSVRMEVIQVKELKHPNLVQFIGACLTHPNVALLTEVMPKGSVSDVLANSNYKINWNFKFSILRDIATGMEFIHSSSLGSHGHLKSTNCLIDNRWTCKISETRTFYMPHSIVGKDLPYQHMRKTKEVCADAVYPINTGFGVPMMRTVVYSPITDMVAVRRSMLWSSPELLSTSALPVNIGKGSKQGDVYSYGIIMTEMCTHQRPFYAELLFLSLDELLRLLKNYNDSGNLGIRKLLEMNNYDVTKFLRPFLKDAAYLPEKYAEKKDLQQLIDNSVEEDSSLRPTFKDLLARLNVIHPLKGGLVENLIFMLEKYANHLEEMLAEKIKEVTVEKNKTEDLISRLLPGPIVEQMKQKIEVLPQRHDNVSILFTDIKGFTAIAKQSTPMQVVELLNDLNTLFDNAIGNYDAYKLETIGDAYCVVSGVPYPNQYHAQDLADLALELMKIVNGFTIKHKPTTKLEIRVGIHSGSCVAGVLGNKMPRYSIFGIDVDIAHHMESTGESKKIQVSLATARILAVSGNYILDYRSDVEVKGAGSIRTYWLIRQITATGSTLSAESGRRRDTARTVSEYDGDDISVTNSRRGSAYSSGRKSRSTIADREANEIRQARGDTPQFQAIDGVSTMSPQMNFVTSDIQVEDETQRPVVEDDVRVEDVTSDEEILEDSKPKTDADDETFPENA